MGKLHRSRGNWRDLVLGGIVLLVVTADQITKWWIRANLADGEILWDVGFLRIINIHNTGAAFGIFRGFNLVFIIIYFVFLAVIVALFIKYHNHHYIAKSLLARVVAGLVLGGMIGNLVDRIRIGHVTDFIDFKIWPAFNVSDSALTLSIIIICVYMIFFWARTPRRQQ
jgi:signal peptidase II